MSDNKDKNLKSYHKQIRQAFFNELTKCLNNSIEILPEEAVNITVYKALVRKAESPSKQEWFLDCFRFYITDKFTDQIMAKDVIFFTNNSDGLLEEHQGSQYGDEAIGWVKKLKVLWQQGRFNPEHEEIIWSFLQILVQLSIREKECRDKL